jgi:hypothetical protein
MREVKIEDLKSMMRQMVRRTRRRSPILVEAERRHYQFMKDLAVYLNDSAEKDRTQD